MAYELKDRQGNVVQRDGETVYVADAETAVKGVNLDRRELTIVGSTETKDRDGDIIAMKGWSFENYSKNPVFLWGHNYSAVPIGTTKRLTRRRDPARLEFLIRFPTEQGVYPFADMVLQLYGDSIIKASSVGFIPKKWEPLEKDDGDDSMMYRPGRRFLKQELLELSGCAVPSNPDAVTNMLKGYQRFNTLGGSSQEGIVNLLLYGPTGTFEEKAIKEAVEAEISEDMEFIDDFKYASSHFVPVSFEKNEDDDGSLEGPGEPPTEGKLEIVEEGKEADDGLQGEQVNDEGGEGTETDGQEGEQGSEEDEGTKEEVDRYRQVEIFLEHQAQEEGGKPVPVILTVTSDGTGPIEVQVYEEEDKEPKEADSYWESMLRTEKPSVQPKDQEETKTNPPEKKSKPVLTPEQGEAISNTVGTLRKRFPKLFRR